MRIILFLIDRIIAKMGLDISVVYLSQKMSLLQNFLLSKDRQKYPLSPLCKSYSLNDL